ncbi:MAG TPA: mechanosensitive ion channel family protein [Bdellovibrionota bacterium]|jgi:small-conductance mechanosensitive channel|nr:mechanosensitive ion channel family protein [Bdellovibrionota bacterium]
MPLSRLPEIGAWLWVAATFAGVLVGGSVAWHFIHRNLQRWAKASPGHWDDVLVEWLTAPARVLVVMSAVVVASNVAPHGIGQHPLSTYAQKIAGVLLVFWTLDRGLRTAMSSRALDGRLRGPSRVLIATVGRAVILAMGGLIVLDTVGISITPILASLGVGSVAVALAAQDTLSNLFSGFYVLLDEPIRVGDLVEIEGGFMGVVQRVGWRSTRLLVGGTNTAVIPNSKLATARLINYNMPDTRTIFSVSLSVARQADLDAVERETLQVARDVMNRTPGALAGFEPVLRFTGFADSGISFNVALGAAEHGGQDLLRHEFLKAIQRRYQKVGIEVPYPQRTLHVNGAEKRALT